MNKTLTLTLALAVAASVATLAGGTAAIAQDGPMREREITREQAEARAASSFARMDANGDGLLNEADAQARQRALFDRIDANGNGAISFAEFAAAREDKAERRAEQARGGQRRGGDRMAMRGRHGGGGHHLAALLRQNADTDGDGSISQTEYTAAALARFERADTDGNGTVTAAERREAMRELRAARRGQDQPRPGE